MSTAILHNTFETTTPLINKKLPLVTTHQWGQTVKLQKLKRKMTPKMQITQHTDLLFLPRDAL